MMAMTTSSSIRVKAEERIEPGEANLPGRLDLTAAAAILNAQAVISHFNHAIHRFFQETFEIATGGPRLRTKNAREGSRGLSLHRAQQGRWSEAAHEAAS